MALPGICALDVGCSMLDVPIGIPVQLQNARFVFIQSKISLFKQALSVARDGSARDLRAGCWLFDVGCSVFPISTPIHPPSPACLGRDWWRSGTTLDIPWNH